MKKKLKIEKINAVEKFRHVSLYELVLFTRVDFCCGPKEEMEKWLKKNKLGAGPERFWDLQGFYTCFKNEEKGLIKRVVWISEASNFYALFHEVVHLTVDIFRDSGMPFTLENEETIAYFQTHWFRQMWHQMGIWNEEDIKLQNPAGDAKVSK